jgi:hypothetical protein
MQTLPSDFHHYVNSFQIHDLILQFEEENPATVYLKYSTKPQQNSVIKRGWKKFCYDNNINFGDTLMFHFLENGQNVANVTKLNCYN